MGEATARFAEGLIAFHVAAGGWAVPIEVVPLPLVGRGQGWGEPLTAEGLASPLLTSPTRGEERARSMVVSAD